MQTGVPWAPQAGETSVYLARHVDPAASRATRSSSSATSALSTDQSDAWDVRIVSSVAVDTVNGRTLVTWTEGLGGAGDPPAAQENPSSYALRQRAALFGYNAIAPRCSRQRPSRPAPPDAESAAPNGTSAVDHSDRRRSPARASSISTRSTPSSSPAAGSHSSPRRDTSRSPSGFVSLYQATSMTSIARSDYGV